MKPIALLLFTCLLALPLTAQNEQKKAEELLNRLSETLRENQFTDIQFSGSTQGTLTLKGEKFLLKTPEITTWFDGKTQWTYNASNNEVTIDTPNPEDLQSINPYLLLSNNHKGYTCQSGTVKTFQNQPVQEVILTASDRRQTLTRIRLYLTKGSPTPQPLHIITEFQGGNQSEITLTLYRTNRNHTDSLFTFDRKQYAEAEIIDLR